MIAFLARALALDLVDRGC